MFKKRKQRISDLVVGAKTFLADNYMKPAWFEEISEVRYCAKAYSPDELKSRKKSGDRYDSRSVDRAVQNLSSAGSSRAALQALEDSTNPSFVDKLLEYIDAKHLRNTEVYRPAQIDRRLFSKIVSDRTYKPAADTCIALALALRLSLAEAIDLLSRAGYALSHSDKRDIVIEYFFREHIYNLNDANEILFALELKLIGR